MPNIIEIDDKNTWESFLQTQGKAPFFQSWNWGEVQKALGNTIYRLGLYKNKKLIGICSVTEIKARRGHYLHLRHGPVLLDFQKDLDLFLRSIKPIAEKIGVEFIRMSPMIPQEFEVAFLRNLGFRNAPVHNMDAENSWVLDLDKTDEELLSNMRKTTRYLVRKAQKMPIEIIQTQKLKDLEEFLRLYTITSKRHGFVPHRGMKEELEIFGKDNQAKLFLAKYEEKIIAGALIIFYGNQAIYHHAASDDDYRNIPAPYLLQWEIIKEAKKLGKKYYNFWGVVPENKPNHPWRGLTLFKTGFGGRRVNLIHAQDLPLRLTYWRSFVIETAWRIKRGY